MIFFFISKDLLSIKRVESDFHDTAMHFLAYFHECELCIV